MDQPIEQESLRILLLEDVPSDAELEESELRDAGLQFTALRVDTRAAFEHALDEFKPDVIIADHRLPTYNGREALEYTRRTHPWIPVIMATGTLGDEAAVELLKLGARDYVIKDRLARLAPAIQRALSEEKGIRNRKLAEGKYKALFTEAMDGIVLIECGTWLIVDCNPEFERQAGRTLAQLNKLKMWEILSSEQRETARQGLLETQKTGSGRGNLALQRPDGTLIPTEFSSRYLNIQQQSFIQKVVRDISERVGAEQALRDSETRYKRITESLTDYQYTVRVENGHAVDTRQSPACVTVTGYKAEEFAANPHLWINMVVPEDRELVTRRLRQVLSGTDVPPIEHRIVRKDGELRWVSDTIILFKDASGKLLSYDGVIRDITERKRAEQVIQDEKTFSESLIQSLPDVFFVIDQQGVMLQGGRRGAELLGVPLEQLRGTSVLAYVHEEDRPLMTRKIRDAFETGSAEGEARLLLTKGVRNYILTGTRIETQRGVNVIGLGVDITERKRTEDELRRANRALRTLSAGNLALVRAKSEDELLHAATSIIVEQGGYRLAVVDFADDNPEKTIRPMAWSGPKEADYPAHHQLTWADTEQGQLPISKTIRNGKTQICRDIASDPGFKLWKDLALARGYVSNIALPLSSAAGTFGGLTIFSSEAHAFDDEEVRLLEELANDLAYGIVTLRTRAEHEQHATILRQSLEQSIQAIASTVEARDPYTAGHQRRVAELATAIAQEMGLPAEQVSGIQLAAMIHDLGKIHVPAEILSKPGKLSDIEFMLIKTHPKSGYDILKNVRFPWPIAEVILQHHERLDGSGYPRGLKGDEILFEARILTVADVVEAMSSHRPYRPTLGALAALSEIDRGRGSSYDPAVVDACRKLFVDKGFHFSD